MPLWYKNINTFPLHLHTCRHTPVQWKMCICWEAGRTPPPCAPSCWKKGSIHHGALLYSSPGFSQTKLSMLFCVHIWFPPAVQWVRFHLSYNGEKERERLAEGLTFLHTHKHTRNPDSEPNKESHMPLYTSIDTHFHAHTHWPLCLPPQGCHWSSNTAKHQSVCDCLLVSFFFLPLTFCPHSLIFFFCSLSILTGICSFWLSLQIIGHI